jgi:hypothetical protein
MNNVVILIKHPFFQKPPFRKFENNVKVISPAGSAAILN